MHSDLEFSLPAWCERCSKWFVPRRLGGKHRYCSPECYWGHAKIDREPRPCEVCGQVFKPGLCVVGRFCSKKCLREWQHSTVGEAHHSWVGGKVCNRYFIEWRKGVFERDGHKCQGCESVKRLLAHHIMRRDEHPELMYDVDNGLTLCDSCHAKRRKTIGTPHMDNYLVGEHRTARLAKEKEDVKL